MSLIDFEQGQCRRISPHLDAYLNDEVTADVADAVRRHLDACRRCRQTVADRSRVKSLLQNAVLSDEAPPGLRYRIERDIRRSASPFRWTTWVLAAAAALVLIAGTFGVVRFFNAPGKSASTEALASSNAHLFNIGLGDHLRCAIDHGMANRRFSREDMTRQLGPDYADVVDLVKRTTPSEYEIVVGHRCHVDGREFVHLILRDQASTVSLIVTAKNGESFASEGLAPVLEESGIPVYQSKLREFEVAGFETRDHLVFVVSALADRDNLRIASSLAPPVRDFLARL
ncbi:MAG TPA: zf-HC2 domain-containing protein [Blastocatellia bacterium]|nr:zf-HC2 domain-containing protein [Blastocatellia bacterium]